MPSQFSIGRLTELACLLEVAAPKPGNVHRGADFEDATLEDFLVSALVLGQIVDEFENEPIGETVLAATRRTREVVGTNTNLGMVLLLVPLAKAAQELGRSGRLKPDDPKLTVEHIQSVLNRLTSVDAEQVFAAIRNANPGGLGTTQAYDVHDSDSAEKQIDLLTAMKAAADRDLIARQYTNGFQQIFQDGVPLLLDGYQRFRKLSSAIVFAHVSLMARFPDSLIARKCGQEKAEHSQMLAIKAIGELVLERVVGESVDDPIRQSQQSNFWKRVGELDFWLRSDGNRRNPGTTADLIAASLFVTFFNGQLSVA